MPVALHIREETPEEFADLHGFIQTAFRTAAVSDGTEQEFADRLRSGDGYIPELGLVAEKEGHIVGYLMLTRFSVFRTSGIRPRLLLAAPLCVARDKRKQGIGSALMREALRRAEMLGYEAILLVGDPDYYERFGFRRSTEYGIRNTDGIPDRFVQLLELTAGALAGSSGTVSFSGI